MTSRSTGIMFRIVSIAGVASVAGSMITSVAGAQTAETGANSAALKSDDELSISGSSVRRTINANGKPVSVSGSSNVITVRGSCSELSVSGSDNTIYVDSVSVISLNGSSNKVYWRKSPTRSGQPSITQAGSDNTASRASGSSQSPSPSQPRASKNAPILSKPGSLKELVITGSNINQTVAADGRPVRIMGSESRVAVTGACPRLTLIGSGCIVQLDSIVSLNVTGSSNNVTWKSSPNVPGKPQITNVGTGNSISKR